MKMDEQLEHLVSLAKQGRQDAFSELVRHLQHKVFRYCYPMLGNRQDAEDAVQETFVRAYEQLHRYEETGAFVGWLLTIAHRMCLNKMKKRRRMLALFRRMAHETAVQGSGVKTDESAAEAMALLEPLPPDARGLVILKVIHGMSYEEMSVIFKAKPASLRKQFERARKKLQTTERIQLHDNVKGGVQIDH
jgi:RNA polymerase sigma-70 factor (ECF subfamily)